MAEITGAQTGNLSDTTSWVGGVVPVDGDTIIIPESIVITVDVNSEIGTGTGTAVNVSGGLTAASGIKFTINGNLLAQATSIITHEAGSEVEFDGDYNYTWYSGSQIVSNGTAQSKAKIGATAGHTLTFSSNDNETQTQIELTHCELRRIGTMNLSGRSVGYTQDILFDRCLLDSYGMIWMYPVETPSLTSTCKFLNCDFRNPTNAEHSIYISKSLEIAENSHVIDGCTFYGSSVKYLTTKLTSTNKFKLTNNKLGNLRLDITGTECTDNYFYSGLSQAELINSNGDCVIEDNLFYSTGYNNPHHIQLSGSTAVSNNISIMDTENGDGNHILATEQDGVVATLENNLTIGDNGVIVRGDRANCVIEVSRHSHVSSGGGLSDDLLIVEEPDFTGIVKVKSSLQVSTTGGLIAGDPESSETELIAGCELDYNNIYNTTFANRYEVPIAGKVLGDTGYGGNDLAVDPDFVDPTATILTLDTSLGGDGSLSNFNTKMFSTNGYDLTGASVTPDTSYTVNDCIAYFTFAYTPQNEDLREAGESGVDIGAFDLAELFSVEMLTNGDGTTDPTGTIEATDGEIIGIEAIPGENQRFVSWESTGDIVIEDDEDATTTATISSDGTITANFELDGEENYILTMIVEQI